MSLSLMCASTICTKEYNGLYSFAGYKSIVGVLVGRSASIGVSQLHTMDFRIWFRIINYTFGWTSPFIYFPIRNAVSKTKTQSLASACLRFAIQIIISKCLFSTDFRIESKTCDKTTLHFVSECELKLERERWPEPTVLIYHRQSSFV